MEKILKPYARPNSIVNVDSGRNVITVAGSRTELENYLRTIRIFDVDWMSSMSVGVFPLQYGKARSEEHTSELQSLMRLSYAVFCLKKKKNTVYRTNNN